MPKKSLRPQLNQIRAWVRQGRTDAWIAHQLEVSAAQLRDFRRQHGLAADDEEIGEVDLRDEIEAEIEAAGDVEEPADEEEPVEGEAADSESEGDAEDRPEGDAGEGRPRRRRRRRRGGRGRKRGPAAIEATFDHGEEEGFGIWLDPSVRDDPTYAERWAGHRPVRVVVEADRIVVTRVGDEPEDEESATESEPG